MDMVTLRRAVKADVDAICAVIASSLRLLGVQEAWTAEQLDDMVSGHASRDDALRLMERHVWLAAWLDGRLVGVASVFRDELAKLFVHPEHHRHGIGTALFLAAEQCVRDSGFGQVKTRCFPASRPFYEAMGMAVVGREPCRTPAFADREVFVMAKSLLADG